MEAYPLTWPEGWPRTQERNRKRAQFSTKRRSNWAQQLTIADGTNRVFDELSRLGITDPDDVVLSSGLILTLSGRPRSGQPEPEDPGVAVYWQPLGHVDQEMKVMAIDLYDRVADNMAAVAATLSAMRAIERHGGAEILERAFTGFVALEHGRSWQSVLGVTEDATLPDCERSFKSLRGKLHPDKPGGSNELYIELQSAISKARKHFNA